MAKRAVPPTGNPSDETIHRCIEEFLVDLDEKKLILTLRELPSFTEADYMRWMVYFGGLDRENLDDDKKTEDIAKLAIAFKYAFKSREFLIDHPEVPLRDAERTLRLACSEFMENSADANIEGKTKEILDKIPTPVIETKGVADILRFHSTLLVYLYSGIHPSSLQHALENQTKLPMGALLLLMISRILKFDSLFKSYLKNRLDQRTKQEPHTNMSPLESTALKDLLEKSKNLGFRKEEISYVFRKMRDMLEAFETSPGAAESVFSSLPEQLFYGPSGTYWNVMMTFMIQFFKKSMLNKTDIISRFHKFYIQKYDHRVTQATPSQVSYPGVSQENMDFLKMELGVAFDSFYDGHNLAHVHGQLQYIFTKLRMDKTLQDTSRTLIGEMYIEKLILKEARRPAGVETDFLEYFNVFCAGQGGQRVNETDTGTKLARLREIVGDLKTLVDSWK